MLKTSEAAGIGQPSGYAHRSNKVFPFARAFCQTDPSHNKTAANQKSKTNGSNMKSTPVRKPENDIMLAPGTAALILIDYQPPQVSTVESIDRQKLINNVVALA